MIRRFHSLILVGVAVLAVVSLAAQANAAAVEFAVESCTVQRAAGTGMAEVAFNVAIDGDNLPLSFNVDIDVAKNEGVPERHQLAILAVGPFNACPAIAAGACTQPAMACAQFQYNWVGKGIMGTVAGVCEPQGTPAACKCSPPLIPLEKVLAGGCSDEFTITIDPDNLFAEDDELDNECTAVADALSCPAVSMPGFVVLAGLVAIGGGWLFRRNRELAAV